MRAYGRERLAGAIVRDQLGDVGIADRDEVAAGRIERIEEHARLARERPAIAREHLLAAVGEVAQEQRSPAAGARLPSSSRASRGWCTCEPLHRLLEAVHRLQRMHASRRRRCRPNASPRPAGSARPSSPRRTGDWSRASDSGGSQRSSHADRPRPLVDVDACVDAEPDRVGVVVVGLARDRACA